MSSMTQIHDFFILLPLLHLWISPPDYLRECVSERNKDVIYTSFDEEDCDDTSLPDKDVVVLDYISLCSDDDLYENDHK